MKNLKKIAFVFAGFLVSAFPMLAQSRRNTGDEEAAAAACASLGCGAFALIYILIIFAMLAIAVVVMVIIFRYIKRDAIARGDNPSKAWFALLGLIGLLIYVLTRPQGNVMPCPNCGQSRMQGLPRCPHCGNP